MLAREGREKSYAYGSKVENKKNKSYVWPLFNHPLHLEPTSCRNPTMFGPTIEVLSITKLSMDHTFVAKPPDLSAL